MVKIFIVVLNDITGKRSRVEVGLDYAEALGNYAKNEKVFETLSLLNATVRDYKE